MYKGMICKLPVISCLATVIELGKLLYCMTCTRIAKPCFHLLTGKCQEQVTLNWSFITILNVIIFSLQHLLHNNIVHYLVFTVPCLHYNSIAQNLMHEVGLLLMKLYSLLRTFCI
eukprot:Gb_22587 [translate_table: standard]